MLKRIIKISSFIVVFIIIIITTFTLFLKQGYFNTFIANQVSSYSGKNINADLKIESITGNVLKDFQINDILITLYEDTLVYCEQIDIDYDFKKILSKSIHINKLHISEIYIHPVQNIDSIWNFSEIRAINNNQDSTNSKLNWNVLVKDLQVFSLIGQIEQVEKSTYIPEYIESEIKLNARYTNNSLRVNLDTLKLYTENPELEIHKLQVNVSYEDHNISWNDFMLELNQSCIRSEGQVNIKSKTIAPSSINIEPFNFEDIQDFFPELELYGTPNIEAKLSGNDKKYDFSFILQENQQKIAINAWLKNLIEIPTYEFNLSVDSLDGAYWTHDEKLKSSIKGSLNIKGEGFDYQTNSIELEGNFGDIIYGDYSLKDLIIKGSKQKDQLTGKLNAKTWLGNLNLKFGLKQIFGNPQYDIYCDYQNLNLKGLPKVDSISTNLNGNIYLVGQGKTLNELNSKLTINSYKSSIINYPVNDFSIQAKYNKGEYSFNGLYLNTPFFVLQANGKGNVYKSNNIDFEFSPINIYDLISGFDIPIYSVQGLIKGNITGSIDSLKTLATVNLSDIHYDSIRVNQLNSDFQIFIKDTLYHGHINLDATKISYNNLSANSIKLTNDFSNNKLIPNLDLNVNDSLKLRFKGKIESFENPLITINQLDIDYNHRTWKSNHDSVYILLTPEYAYINRFYLASDKQQFKLHGYFTFEGNEDLDIQIENFDLEQVPFQKLISYPVKGRLNTSIKISGSSENPAVKSNLLIENLDVNQYPVELLTAEITYENNLLIYNGIINSALHRYIKTNAKVPLHFSISDETYLLKDNPELQVSVRMDSVDVKKIYSFFPIKDITVDGLAFTNLSIENTINNPNLNGSFQIINGNFENKAFGAYYKNIEISTIIKDNRLSIQKFNLKTNKKGELNLDGFIHFKSELAIIPNDFQFNIQSTNFQALKSSRAELNFDTDLSAGGTFKNPVFKGNMKISRSRINADYFGQYLTQKTDDPNPPLLIAAMQDTNQLMIAEKYHKPGSDFSGTAFYKSLNGEATLQIPGNTWIRGKDMNFELEGNLRVLKSTENLDLFGTLKVKRGFYKIYGKNFNFNKGELTFTGGKEINPQLDFVVLYRFRDIDKELRKLSVVIKGRLNEPELSFYLDDEQLEEKDAIAYIVFGKSINQLSDSQLNKLSGNDNFALNLALDQLSDILKETLQSTARLDVVEITGGDNWKTNSVTLGKYITNKLYLSYEQSFSLDKKSKFMDSEKLMLEYQLLRNIILKATNQNSNSGFDLIFKKTWK